MTSRLSVKNFMSLIDSPISTLYRARTKRCVTPGDAHPFGTANRDPIYDSSFTCEDDNTDRAHPSSPFPLRRARPGPGPHKTSHPEISSGGKPTALPLRYYSQA